MRMQGTFMTADTPSYPNLVAALLIRAIGLALVVPIAIVVVAWAL
jgi:hypothetical protein